MSDSNRCVYKKINLRLRPNAVSGSIRRSSCSRKLVTNRIHKIIHRTKPVERLSSGIIKNKYFPIISRRECDLYCRLWAIWLLFVCLFVDFFCSESNAEEKNKRISSYVSFVVNIIVVLHKFVQLYILCQGHRKCILDTYVFYFFFCRYRQQQLTWMFDIRFRQRFSVPNDWAIQNQFYFHKKYNVDGLSRNRFLILDPQIYLIFSKTAELKIINED